MSVPVGRAMLASQKQTGGSTDIIAFPSHQGAHGMMLMFNDYTFISPGERTLINVPAESSTRISPRGAILLPIPAALIDNNSLRVRGTDLAGVPGSQLVAEATAEAKAQTAAAGGFFGASLGLLGTAISAPFQAAGAMATNAYNNGPWQDAAQLIMTTMDRVGQAVSIGGGIALNPRASLLFDGIDLKEYAFEWTLVPKSPEESILIRNVIQKLKQNALPSYATNGTFARAMLNYPATVDISLLGVDPDHYFRFKTAMIKNVNVNYTPNGLSILRGGKPSAVNISINLIETDIHTAEDYGFQAEQQVTTAGDQGTSTSGGVTDTGGVILTPDNVFGS